MTEQKPAEHPEFREPEILGEIEPEPGLMRTLVQHLTWLAYGDREATRQSIYLHYGDASISINNSELVFAQYREVPDGGASADGVVLTLTPKQGGFAEMPRTINEESEVEEYIERLESELRSYKASHRQMERQISDLEARLGEPAAAGTS